MAEKTTTTKKVSTIKKVEKVPVEKKTKVPVSLDAIVYAQTGTKSGTFALSEKVFGVKWNADLVHQVVVGMMANARAGTAHTKDRSEVSGGGKKPWRQKGTGRARHGSSRSPIWVGGGTTFGPRNDKDYSKKINKKTRVKALFTVLSRKYSLGNILFLDALTLPAIKTKPAHTLLTSWTSIPSFETINTQKRTSTLLVLPEASETLAKSFANIPGVTLTTVSELNAVVVMHFKHIVMVNPKAAVQVLEAKMK